MPKKIDIKNKRFGRLIALYEKERGSRRRHAIWHCVCDCGKEVDVSKQQLLSLRTKSCGCYRKEKTSKKMKTHGLSKKRIYHIWCRMKSFCLNKKSSKFKNYGERGIYICDKWKKSFESFEDWAEKSGYNDSLTIDRIDVNGNYEPNNCRWIPMKDQAWNKRNTVYITINGKKMNLKEAEKNYGIKYQKIYNRLQRGWSPERAVFT